MVTLPLAVAIIIAALVVGTGAVAVRSEMRASRRRREISAAESFLMGAGAGGISLYEVYEASDDHEALLNTLQDRFNDAIPEDVGPLQWSSYFEGKLAAGEQSVGGVVSAWVGELAEHHALDYYNSLPELKAQGIRAVMHPDPTHEGTDIFFVGPDGEPVDLPEVQCKSFGDAGDFLSSVREYQAGGSDVRNFVVNSEVYQQLEASGKLDELAGQGISIENGEWSHEALKQQTEGVVGDFGEAADVAEDVPLLAAFFFGRRVVSTVGAVSDGRATLHEGATDVAMDAGRFALGGVAAAGGAKAGAAIGTMVAPGIGTIIGGGLGALAGALATSSLLKAAKEWFKYRKIKRALEAIGERFMGAAQGGATDLYNVQRSIFDKVYDGAAWRRRQGREESLAGYHPAPRPYGSEPITPMSLLVKRFSERCTNRVNTTWSAATQVPHRLVQLCSGGGEAQVGLLGEIAAANADVLLDGVGGLEEHLSLYRAEMEHYPNHPYRWKGPSGVLDSRNVFATVCAETAEQSASSEAEPETGRGRKALNYLLIVLALAAGLGLAGLYLAGRVTVDQDQPWGSVSASAPLESATSALAEPEPAATRAEPRAVVFERVVTVKRASCRARPRARSVVRARVRKGDRLRQLDFDGRWVRVENPQGKGRPCWIFAKSLSEADVRYAP